MSSRERSTGEKPQFLPSARFKDLYDMDSPDVRIIGTQLQVETAKMQSQNEAWIEAQLVRARDERKDSLIDILLVDEKGGVVNAFSSYRSYVNNAHLQITFDDLAQYSRKRGVFVYPLVSRQDQILFWHRDNDRNVVPVIQKHFGEVELEDYMGVKGQGGDVQLCRTKKGIAGVGKFAADGIVFGNLGFWNNNRLQLGKYGPRNFIERVRFEQSRVLVQPTYISPLDPEDVHRKKGTPMDEKYPNLRVIRIPKDTSEDFITLALEKPPVTELPTVLGYSTIRPWLGEAPSHGN